MHFEFRPYILPMLMIDEPAEDMYCSRIIREGELFYPLGLALWGVSDRTTVRIYVDVEGKMPTTPAERFSTLLDFDVICESFGLGDKFPDGQYITEKFASRIKASVTGSLGFSVLLGGHSDIRLAFEGPVKAALFWGMFTTK